MYIDANKDDIVEGRKLGVELICRVSQVAPSTYYHARGRAPSARALTDAVLSGRLISSGPRPGGCIGFANSGKPEGWDHYRTGSDSQVDAVPWH